METSKLEYIATKDQEHLATAKLLSQGSKYDKIVAQGLSPRCRRGAENQNLTFMTLVCYFIACNLYNR